MPKFIACMIAYNEEKLLPQCLDSIVDKVDEIVVVEGRIKEFPGKGARSTDRTIEIVKDYGATVITQPTPWIDEPTMRNKYLVGKEGDWYLFIDADEKCMTGLPDIADFPAGIIAYSVNIKMISAPVEGWRPRIFRHTGQMEYRKIHDALFSDNKLISRLQETTKLYSIWFAHYQMARGEQRRQKKTVYYTDGYEHEADYRKEWRMLNQKEST